MTTPALDPYQIYAHAAACAERIAEDLSTLSEIPTSALRQIDALLESHAELEAALLNLQEVYGLQAEGMQPAPEVVQ